MAVQLNLDAVRDAVDPLTLRTAEALLADGRIGDITALGGGATTTVDDTTVWVGIVNQAFAAECDCAHTHDAGKTGDDELCAHAVALTLSAIRAGFAWSSAANPPSQPQAVVDPKVHQLTALAATLSPRRLAALVGEWAATDRKLETRLMTYAGKLGAPTGPELAATRETIDGIATEATSGRWDLADVARAGHLIVDELAVLAQRPPVEDALALVEEAARRWDELSVHLHGAYYDRVFAEDPSEIGDALRAIHVGMCERLDVDPDELLDVLLGIVQDAESTSCLDVPDDYLAVLGPERVNSLRRQQL